MTEMRLMLRIIVMKAGFFSMMIERSFSPNKGTGSLSDKITPYFGKSCLSIRVLRPFENELLPITS